jgi:pimeloyl-ACP methyl ester carboxylesterase/DNA-binding winged helix-turn-helix (wHTH) protein
LILRVGVTDLVAARRSNGGGRGMRYVFGSCEMDKELFELRRGQEVIPIEPQVFDVLAYLVDHRDRVVGKDELFEAVWGGRAVSISTLTSRINAARTAIGDNGSEQRLIKTFARRGYRFVGDVSVGAAPAVAVPDAQRGLRQSVKFAMTCDGVRIAYATVGKGSLVVKAGNWLNHLEYDWESPVWSHLLHWLAASHELVRYDARGNGLSDWDVAEISLDAFVRDLEAVVDDAGLDRFVLFGASQGCAVSIAYAVRHPDRVSKLVLYGGFARGRSIRGSPEEIAQAEAMLTLMRTGWGQENPAFRQTFTSLFIPGATTEQMAWFNNLQKVTTSPENAMRMRRVSDQLDIRAHLERVAAPTLVLHCHDDAVQPFEEGRRLAAGIPNARFVGLEGANHLILEADPGWSPFCQAIDQFLAQ